MCINKFWPLFQIYKPLSKLILFFLLVNASRIFFLVPVPTTVPITFPLPTTIMHRNTSGMSF